MPKVVDAAERRRVIVEAVIAVAARDGLAATSVRAVGAEAGMSAGALRHYFSDQEQLMVFALEQLAAWVGEAMQEATGGADERAAGRELLRLLVPRGPEEAAAARIWFEVATLVPRRPALRGVWDRTVRDIRGACAQAVRAWAPGLAPQESARAVDDLHVFIDGLALHACYRGDVDPAWVDRLLDARLASLAAT